MGIRIPFIPLFLLTAFLSSTTASTQTTNSEGGVVSTLQSDVSKVDAEKPKQDNIPGEGEKKPEDIKKSEKEVEEKPLQAPKPEKEVEEKSQQVPKPEKEVEEKSQQVPKPEKEVEEKSQQVPKPENEVEDASPDEKSKKVDKPVEKAEDEPPGEKPHGDENVGQKTDTSTEKDGKPETSEKPPKTGESLQKADKVDKDTLQQQDDTTVEKDKQLQEDEQESDGKDKKADAIDTKLQEEFEKVAEDVKHLQKSPSNRNKLELYGLYKQATTGNCNIDAPSRFRVRDRAKWNAWNEKRDKSKETAMKDYIKKANILIEAIGLEVYK